LEKITDSQIYFSRATNVSEEISKEVSLKKNENISLNISKFNRNKYTMEVEFIFQSNSDKETLTSITLIKTRELFISGMNQINKFMWIYAHIMVLIWFAVFTLLGRYISRPFSKLINEVKYIDLTKNKIKKLKVYGNDEFAFLRKSINNMLNKIEIEQFKVRENKEKLYSILSSVGDGVIAVDRNGNVSFINEIAQNLTGWSKEEAYGESFENVFKIIDEYTREKLASPIQKVVEQTKGEENIELENNTILVSKDGLERAIEDTASPIKDKFGNINGVVLVFRDISEKKEKRKQIEFLSYHDQLTGVFNRRYFEEALKKLDTSKNLPLSIVFADANGLKTINDAFGHEYGDLLIQEVSDVLKEEFRDEDIVCSVLIIDLITPLLLLELSRIFF